MSLVYGEPDPRSASARRAPQSVAPIATRVRTSQQSNREPAPNATRATPKRNVMDNEQAIPVVSEISSTRGSTSISDSAAEHGKPLNWIVLSKDTTPVVDDTILSEYEEVFKLLTENPPEQVLDILVPYSKYNQMEAAFSRIKADKNISEDQRYPYLSYNSLTETVTVVTVPNSIHEVAVHELNVMFDSATEYLSDCAPWLYRNILPLGSTTTDDFEGDYAHSSKQPDGGVAYNAIGAGSRVTIATDVGISQSYKSLCDAKDVWINGHRVKVCVLVYVNELSRFRNPSTAYDSIEDVRTEITTMTQSVAEPMRWYESHGYYGPIVYRRHKWAGELNEAFVEIWRPGKSSPDRYELIRDGFACHNLPTTLGLNMSDMVTDEAWEAAGAPDREIRFNSARFMTRLMNAMLFTAQARFRKFISESTR
ncbi:hypothetical protein V1527DRAFT_416268 [Lipomyces starkeyi]